MQVIATVRTQLGVGASSSTAALSAMSTVALHLARRLTQPPAAQLRSMGPNSAWRHSQACSRGELRAAAQPAMRMKTVVGRPGTNTPAMPSARHSRAKAISSPRASGDAEGRGGGVSQGGLGLQAGGSRGVAMGGIVPRAMLAP